MAKDKLKIVKIYIYIFAWRKLCDGALKYYIMAPSWISMSMSMLLKSRKAFLLTLIIIIYTALHICVLSTL